MSKTIREWQEEMKMKLDANQKKGSIRLSGRGIWEKRFPLWGQLGYNVGNCNTFTSIVWRDGDLHAYIMAPYLCYSGDEPITYTRLSAADTMRILWIAAKSEIRHAIHYGIPSAYRKAYDQVSSFFYKPIKMYNNYKAKKEMDKLFSDL